MSQAERPKPILSDLSRPLWEAYARKELVAQQCTACGELRHYPQPMCPDCYSTEFGWSKLAGTGLIYSYTVSHRAFHPAWEGCVPYVIATIELDEGVRMVCDMPRLAPDKVAIGQRVGVEFESLPGQGVMPRFRLIED